MRKLTIAFACFVSASVPGYAQDMRTETGTYRLFVTAGGKLLRASAVCNSVPLIEAEQRMMGNFEKEHPEYKAWATANPDVAALWLMQGAQAFDEEAAEVGVVQACSQLATTAEKL